MRGGCLLLTVVLVGCVATGCDGDSTAAVDASTPDASNVDAAGPAELAVMTFNIRYGTASDGDNSWIYRKDLAFGVLEDYAPAVAGLQEVVQGQRADLAARFPDHEMFGVGRNADLSGEQVTIFYDPAQVTLLEGDTFWLSETPDVRGSVGWDAALPRICTWARFRAGSGETFYVFNVHLDHIGETARLEGARLVLERIELRSEADPVLVTGDFNSDEDTPPVQVFSSFVETFRAIHPDATEVGTRHDFTGATDGPKIDYVFASADITPLDAAIHHDNDAGRYPSDHFPVSARLELPAPGP